jgi:hypothetical protein
VYGTVKVSHGDVIRLLCPVLRYRGEHFRSRRPGAPANRFRLWPGIPLLSGAGAECPIRPRRNRPFPIVACRFSTLARLECSPKSDSDGAYNSTLCNSWRNTNLGVKTLTNAASRAARRPVAAAFGVPAPASRPGARSLPTLSGRRSLPAPRRFPCRRHLLTLHRSEDQTYV